MELKMENIGRVNVGTVPLPEGITEAIHPMYTSCGKIIFAYKPSDDKDAYEIATIGDDGSDFQVIFRGKVALKPTGNGFRMMPFFDGKRVLLGDYVLETTPSIADCKSAELIPVEYPALLMNNPRATHHWSEIVIAQDNVHMAWTSLHGFSGAQNYLGALHREADRYVLDNVQVISSMTSIIPDPANPGYLLPQVARGGEIKQFVQGGTALTLVGAAGGTLPGSVVQDFLSERIDAITLSPGYDETTILSPDERLGIVMSPRSSAKTNFALLGLLPRPYGGIVGGALTMNVYLYAVAAVRAYRKGNIGPVLIDVARSMAERGYPGLPLNDPEENWVYYSPMSWHPSGKSVIWPECLRGTKQGRIQVARLLDYEPAVAIKPRITPDSIPYGVPIEKAKAEAPVTNISGKIAGKHAGYALYTRKGAQAKIEYFDMSDDGERYYHGYELSGRNADGGLTYEANVTMDGGDHGEMDLRLAFTPFNDHESLPTLKFDTAADGKPMSTGTVTYQGVTLAVEDMRE